MYRRALLAMLMLMVSLGAFPLGASAQATPDAARTDPWVQGSALALFPPDRFTSDDGLLLLGAVPTYNGAGIAVLLQNPAVDVREVGVVVEARDVAGKLLAIAEIDGPGLEPPVIESGALGFGVANFGDVELPTSARFTATWTYYPVAGGMYGHANVPITSQDRIDDRIVGEVYNPTSETMISIGVDLLCFDAGGQVQGMQEDFVANDVVPAFGSGVFQIDIDKDYSCASYMIVAHGVPKI